MIKTLAEINEEVTRKLSQNANAVSRRREDIRAIAKKVRMLQDRPLLRRRRNAWFSTTQGNATKRTPAVNVQLLGIQLGKLFLRDKPAVWYFEPKKEIWEKVNNGFLTNCNPPWRWSHSRQHGKCIRLFLDSCRNLKEAKSTLEREIQWQLAHALRSDKSGWLRNLQPVTWHDDFTEFGVTINENQEISRGNIDLMVRRANGADRGFLVFEVKGPGEGGFEEALSQALTYATALDFEANGEGGKYREDYHNVFGSSGKGNLKIGAVVVMRSGLTDSTKARRILDQCCSAPGESKLQLNKIGFLPYDFDGTLISFPSEIHWYRKPD